jgi:hypothetical protein
MKHASVYQRGKRLIVHPYARTIDWIDVASEPCVAFPADVADATLGESVQAALSAWRVGIAPPTSWPQVLAPLLRAAGVRSWSAFARGARHVAVGDDGVHLRLVAGRDLGDRSAYGQDGEPIFLSRDRSTAELGALIKHTLLTA